MLPKGQRIALLSTACVHDRGVIWSPISRTHPSSYYPWRVATASVEPLYKEFAECAGGS